MKSVQTPGAAGSGDADRKLAETASRLKAHLKQLEAEYLRLTAELKRKRALRAKLAGETPPVAPEAAPGIARQRAARLGRNIEKSGVYVRKQSAFLQKVKAFHERNERLLLAIAERLESLEAQLQSPGGASPDARAKFQSELVTMLAELQSMRTKREALRDQVANLGGGG